jgi:hypothetical protein
VRPIGHGFAAFALIVCVQTMTWACGSRAAGAGNPVPSNPVRAPDTPGTEPTRSREAGPDDCALIAVPGEPIATVGLTDRIDPSNAPHATNASERMLFGQLYETLVRVDCMGRVRPGLATSWQLDQRSGLWFVTLRENAGFSDGTPVTAADVRASWTRDGIGGAFRTRVSRLVDWVDVVGDRTLVIQLSYESRRFDLPVVLAHHDLAVAKWVADSPVPLGTRSSRLEPGRDAARGIALSELTVSRDHLPPLRFLVAAGDPRDLLDAGVDLLLTRDPATLEYAATLTQFERVPLPWRRTHILLTPGRPPLSPSLSEDARQALAADAVRGEARGAQGPFWWEAAACELLPRTGSATQALTPRVVYDANDGAARDLAERFVGLVGASGPAATTFLDAVLPDRSRRTFQRATGLTGKDLANALRLGADAGYVVSVESRPLEPCHALLALMDSVPWVPGTIIPLVDTRLQAVFRRGRSGLTADFDGALVIDGVNDPARR